MQTAVADPTTARATPRTRWWLRSTVTIPVAFFLFFGLAVALKWAVWVAPLSNYGGSADVEQKMWFLTWTPFAVGSHHNPLVSSYLNYPVGVNLMWNTPMPLIALLFWPVTAIWGAIVTYNVVTTAAMALAAGFAFLAIRRYVHGDLAAACGGLLYGFSPAMIAQNTGHASPVVSAVTVPLALLLLDELVVRQRLRPWLLGLLIGILGIAQFLIFEEFFAFEIGFGALLIIVLALTFRHEVFKRAPYALRATGVAAVLIAAGVAYPLYVQFLGPLHRLHSLPQPAGFSIDSLNLVYPTVIQAISPSFATSVSSHFSNNSTEADGYLGIPLLILAIVVLIKYWRNRVVRVAGIMAVVITICSLGPKLQFANHTLPIPLPWWLPSKIPVLRSLLPARMMFFTFLACGFLFAYALHRLWLAPRRRVLGGLAAVLTAAVVITPLAPALPLYTSTLNVPSYFKSPAAKQVPDASPVLTVPWPGVTDMAGMDWQVASGFRFRLVGGYFQGVPAGDQDALYQVATSFSGPKIPHLGPDVTTRFLKQLHNSKIGAVILGQVGLHDLAVSYISSALGPPAHVDSSVTVWLLQE